jgi:hypothetical protein
LIFQEKNAGFAGVFFALFASLCYGRFLESWGRLRATGIRSKTQEKWGFPDSFRIPKPPSGMGFFFSDGTLSRKAQI